MSLPFTASAIVVLLATALFTASESLRVNPFFAARCIARSKQCGPYDARFSGSCKAGTVYWQQPRQCVEYACNWCKTDKSWSRKAPCTNWRVRGACFNLNKEAPSPSPRPVSPGGGICRGVWRGSGDNVVIDLGRSPLGQGWQYVSRGGYKGMIFKQSPARGISPPGRYGRICYKVQAPQDGKYYFTAISYAPHVTEHNDVWVATSKGFELWQAGNYRKYVAPGSWLKAYQNNGKKGISEHFKTIDFDGHRFLIPNVKAYRTFEVCIAGRSKKYEMYRLILKKCVGAYCRGKIKKGKELFDMQPSRCLN